MRMKPPPKRGAGGKAPQFRLFLYLYSWLSRQFSPAKTPGFHLWSPRLLGGFKGLSRINISSAVVFFTLF